MGIEELAWGASSNIYLCPECDWLYVRVEQEREHTEFLCPHCYQGTLTPVDTDPTQSFSLYSPEMMIPPTASDDVIAQGIQNFAEAIPFPPLDLSSALLRERLELLFLPVWLVDCQVYALWEAEVGFDYAVVSHQEHYVNGQWLTREVEETRVRWEPRVGRLENPVHNISVPAMLEHAKIWTQLGSYSIRQAEQYKRAVLDDGYVRLPDQTPENAWSSAVPLIQKYAADKVMSACSAEHIRNFRWMPQYQDQHWTFLLVPVYTTFYVDDHGLSHPVFIHAGTGKVDGPRRSSMKRAQHFSLILALIAFVGFIVSLVLGAFSVLVPPLAVLGILLGLVSTGVGIGALLPMIQSWRFNEKVKQSEGG